MINTDDCWLYAGYKDPQGYGRIFYTKNGKTHYEYSHRVSYETFKKPIKDPLVIDHLCKVRHCMNPDHLEPVTVRINTLRGDGVLINKNKTHCQKGHEYSPDNTRLSKQGWRVCRTCEMNRHKEYYRIRNAPYA